LSLLELETEIERKAEEEVSRIIENAKSEAERTIAEANARAEALRDEKSETLTRELNTEGRAELAISRMCWKGELLRLRSGWADRVFEETEKRIAEMAENDRPGYRELLIELILEGIAKTRGNKFIAEANSRDVEAIRKELQTILARAAKIKNDTVVVQTRALPTATLGGVVVRTEDSTQYYNNILEARLSAAKRNLAGKVYKILFRAGEQNE